MTKIKICGITNFTDAQNACNLGADAIGFVFFEKSKRYVQPENIQWIHELPAFTQIVGLFVNAEAKFVKKVCQTVPLDILQFHGNESPSYCQQFQKRYIKAVPMQNLDKNRSIQYIKKYSHASGFLLDNYGNQSIGGSGKSFDLNQVPNQNQINKPLILAGGFNPNNIKDIILKNNPYAVDVSSGVETSPGIKSLAKMERFISQVRNLS